MHETIRFFFSTHYSHIWIIIMCVATIIIAMAVDLFFGVRKAKENGEARTSTGYKKTCEKGRKYFMPYLCLLCIDVIASVVMPVPAFSMIWAAWCIFCEFKSVREKAWTKAELRKAERTMSIIIENREDIAKMVGEMILASQKSQPRSRRKKKTPPSDDDGAQSN